MQKFNKIDWREEGPAGIEKHIHPRLPSKVLSSRVRYLWEKFRDVDFDWDALLGISGAWLLFYGHGYILREFVSDCRDKQGEGWSASCSQCLSHLVGLWSFEGEATPLEDAARDLLENGNGSHSGLLIEILLRLLVAGKNSEVCDISQKLLGMEWSELFDLEQRRFIEYIVFARGLEDAYCAAGEGKIASPTSYFKKHYKGPSLYDHKRLWVMLSQLKRDLNPEHVIQDSRKGGDHHFGAVQVAFMKALRNKYQIPFSLSILFWQMAEQLFFIGPLKKKFYYDEMIRLEDENLLDFAFKAEGSFQLLYLTQIWGLQHLFAFLVEKGLVPDVRIYQFRNFVWYINRRLVMENEEHILRYSLLKFIPADLEMKKGFDMQTFLEDALKPNSARRKELAKELRDCEDFNELYFSKMPTSDR